VTGRGGDVRKDEDEEGGKECGEREKSEDAERWDVEEQKERE
jgi:hypothetical protein